MRAQPTYEIDGTAFSTLEEFAGHFSSVVLGDHAWHGNLDAFNDILRGGFGTPDGGFKLRWRNSGTSRDRLGYPETVRQLELRLAHCHPSNREHISAQLAAASRGVGPTVFDWLLETIRDHGDGGTQAEDRVVLELA